MCKGGDIYEYYALFFRDKIYRNSNNRASYMRIDIWNYRLCSPVFKSQEVKSSREYEILLYADNLYFRDAYLMDF